MSSRRRRTIAAAAIGAGAAAALTVMPALASASTPKAPAIHYHFDADHMGSGLEALQAQSGVRANVVMHAPAGTQGLDVSAYQGNVNWSSVKANGASFAYIKATEGTGYTNPYFAQQYVGSYNVGLIRGSYHFALPNVSSGAAQADYFASHGGAWSRDGKTLPGALDIEYNPYGSTCYGLSQGGMVNWIASFLNEYHARTSRWAVIYSTTNWWSSCTGNYGGFANNNPFWVANYNGTPNPLPNGWGFYTFWQWADHGVFPGDQDVFNGAYSRLQALANG